MEDDGAAFAHDVENEVALADRTSAREDQQVVLQRLGNGAMEVGQGVARGAQARGQATVFHDERRQREGVDVVDVTGGKRGALLGDFVARRQNRHARPRHHLDLGQPERGERTQAAGVDEVTGTQHRLAGCNVGRAGAHVLPGTYGSLQFDGVAVRTGGFDHHDRVGPLWQRRPGGNLHARAAARVR